MEGASALSDYCKFLMQSFKERIQYIGRDPQLFCCCFIFLLPHPSSTGDTEGRESRIDQKIVSHADRDSRKGEEGAE
jgi:hypothetical protein